MPIVHRCSGGGETGIVPVILQKFIKFAKYRRFPFRISLAAPRCFGNSTIAGSLPVRGSHKPMPVPHAERCTRNAPTARIIANDSDFHLHTSG